MHPTFTNFFTLFSSGYQQLAFLSAVDVID
jgi:hypothetical protein